MEKHDPSYELYFGEGCSYEFFYNGQRRGVQMQAMHSLHAGGGAMSHQVNQRSSIPQGTWVVEFELFCGSTPVIVIHHWGTPQIKGETA